MKRSDRSDLEIEVNKPRYPQPHNVRGVVADNDYQRLIFALKQHARLKYEAKNGNGYHKSPPIKRLPYRN